MALLFRIRDRVETAAGLPVSGGKLRLYDANTTNLTPVFSDVGLSTPLANPIVADSAGFLPQYFAAEGTICDGDYLTAGDVVISGQSFVDGVFVGDNTGVIVRDFTNSRYQTYGSGGTVNIEAGDPSPDDIGGTLRLGGWANTQADTIELDAAAITTTGKITENGKKLQGVVYTPATTFTTATNVDILLPNDPTGVVAWEIYVWDYFMSTSGNNLHLRMSFDGGSTFNSGASDYDWAYGSFLTGTGAAATAHTTAAQIQLASTPQGATNKPGTIKLTVITPRTGNNCTRLIGRLDGVAASGEYQSVFVHGYGPASAGPITHIRLFPHSSATHSGKYRVVPLRGFGE